MVSDGFSGMSSSGITSTSHDVKLTTGGNLIINQAVALGTGNLTLSVTGNVTQGASGVLTAAGLQLMGAGSAHLDNGANDVTTLAAKFNGPIRYTDLNSLTVGTVSDGFSGMTSSAMTSASYDLTLNDALPISINQAVALGTGNLTLSVTGNVTQGASGVITASGLQLMGAGSAHLDNGANDITTLAASFNGPISYTDLNSLTVGTVGRSEERRVGRGRRSRRDDV